MQNSYLKVGVVLVLALSGLVLADGKLSSKPASSETYLCSKVKTFSDFQKCLSQTAQEGGSKLSGLINELNTQLKEVEEDNSLAKGCLVQKLEDSQNAWEEFKKRNCDFYAKLALSKEHGAVAYSACEIRMQQERFQELEVERDFYREQKELSRKGTIYAEMPAEPFISEG